MQSNNSHAFRRASAGLQPTIRHTASRVVVMMAMLGALTPTFVAESSPRQWTEDELTASYETLVDASKLEAAILEPKRPGESPNAAFLEALAWYADGMSDVAGSLSLSELDAFLKTQIAVYRSYLEAKVTRGVNNDYARTRTWKVIQKLSLLRDHVTAEGSGAYDYGVFSLASPADDPWEREHTVASVDDFRSKVCRGSLERPILVKYGNTNCTQCMLFELTGSIKDIADSSTNRDSIDVYKVWWGTTPDDTFNGRIAQPALLDELAKEEGVHSSPYFIVYRNGRRYPCGSAFPDRRGADEHLQSCIEQTFGDAPVARTCASMLGS